jgi:thymidine kinase
MKKLGVGYLEVHFGPMFACKSSTLKSRLIHYDGRGFKVCYITHGLDIRNETQPFSTHSTDKTFPEGITQRRSDNLSTEDVSCFDVIGLDEAQFFSVDLVTSVLNWVNVLKKIVIVAGLDLTAELKRWRDVHLEAGHSSDQVGDIIDLVPYADIVQKHYAECEDCLKENGYVCPAPFTKRLQHGSVIQIGDSKIYSPCCRFHHSQ